MASVTPAALAAERLSRLLPTVHHSSAGLKTLGSNVSLPRFTSRFRNTARADRKLSSFLVTASNPESSGGESISKKPAEVEAGDNGRGPPFLTILAGFLVFFFICWILGSFLIWLIGLLVKSPPK